jgi:hypothetical protein
MSEKIVGLQVKIDAREGAAGGTYRYIIGPTIPYMLVNQNGTLVAVIGGQADPVPVDDYKLFDDQTTAFSWVANLGT